MARFVLENNYIEFNSDVKFDVVRMYPDILHNAGLKALNNMLEEREHNAASTDDLFKMARFVLENNYIEFNSVVKK